MLKYYSILEFLHAIAIIPMQVLLLYSNYAHFIMVKTPQTQIGTNFSPPLSILTAVINGQNVTVLMLVAI